MMFPAIMEIDATLIPLLTKYAFIFEFNGLKFRLPDDYDEQAV